MISKVSAVTASLTDVVSQVEKKPEVCTVPLLWIPYRSRDSNRLPILPYVFRRELVTPKKIVRFKNLVGTLVVSSQLSTGQGLRDFIGRFIRKGRQGSNVLDAERTPRPQAVGGFVSKLQLDSLMHRCLTVLRAVVSLSLSVCWGIPVDRIPAISLIRIPLAVSIGHGSLTGAVTVRLQGPASPASLLS